MSTTLNRLLSSSSQSTIQIDVRHLRETATEMRELSLLGILTLPLKYTGFHSFRSKGIFEKPRKAMKILLKNANEQKVPQKFSKN